MRPKYNLNNKKFIAVENKQGLSSKETIFSYFQEDMKIAGNYQGGQMIGKFCAEDEIELLFQCLTKDLELKVGKSRGKITRDKRGNLQLSFTWKWLDDDFSEGVSFYEELIE